MEQIPVNFACLCCDVTMHNLFNKFIWLSISLNVNLGEVQPIIKIMSQPLKKLKKQKK